MLNDPSVASMTGENSKEGCTTADSPGMESLGNRQAEGGAFKDKGKTQTGRISSLTISFFAQPGPVSNHDVGIQPGVAAIINDELLTTSTLDTGNRGRLKKRDQRPLLHSDV